MKKIPARFNEVVLTQDEIIALIHFKANLKLQKWYI